MNRVGCWRAHGEGSTTETHLALAVGAAKLVRFPVIGENMEIAAHVFQTVGEEIVGERRVVDVNTESICERLSTSVAMNLDLEIPDAFRVELVERSAMRTFERAG